MKTQIPGPPPTGSSKENLGGPRDLHFNQGAWNCLQLLGGTCANATHLLPGGWGPMGVMDRTAPQPREPRTFQREEQPHRAPESYQQGKFGGRVVTTTKHMRAHMLT